MNNIETILIGIIIIFGIINIIIYRLLIIKKSDQMTKYLNRGLYYDMGFLTLWFFFGFIIIPYTILIYTLKYLRKKISNIAKKLIKYL